MSSSCWRWTGFVFRKCHVNMMTHHPKIGWKYLKMLLWPMWCTPQRVMFNHREGGNLLPIAIQSEFCPEHDASGVSSHMHRGSVSSLILASYFAAWSTVKVSETPSQSTLFRFHDFGGSVTLRYCHFCLFHGILEISPKKSIGVAGKAYTLSKLIIR